MVIKMQEKRNLFKESINDYQKNIAVLQAINVIYITIIFLLFVTGIYFLGIWSLFLAMLVLPMFSLSYNYIAHKLIHRKEEIYVSDIFKGRKYFLPSISQYYHIYKRPILWSVLSFFASTMICSMVYVGIIGIDNIMTMVNENGEVVLDSIINSESYLRYSTLSQVISVIICYFVFTITRQRYQFIPLIMQNGSFDFKNCEKVGKGVYIEMKKSINKGNMIILSWWLFSFVIASLLYIIFNNLNLFTFDILLLISIFVFLFIGSFSISIKVLFKNKMFYTYIYPGVKLAKEKILQKEQDK